MDLMSDGVVAMLSVEKCRERSEECKRKAEAVSDARDRAKWLKLADDWTALTRLPFHNSSKEHKGHDSRIVPVLANNIEH
jgi:hypothetical protein